MHGPSELFDHELQDLDYAEHQVMEALKTLADQSSDGEFKKAFQSHRRAPRQSQPPTYLADAASVHDR